MVAVTQTIACAGAGEHLVVHAHGPVRFEFDGDAADQYLAAFDEVDERRRRGAVQILEPDEGGVDGDAAGQAVVGETKQTAVAVRERIRSEERRVGKESVSK